MIEGVYSCAELILTTFLIVEAEARELIDLWVLETFLESVDDLWFESHSLVELL